jgi:hypothetical protein
MRHLAAKSADSMLMNLIILAVFRPLCQQVAYEVNSLPADFLAIATQGLVNAKYQGSQILLCAYPSQSRIGAGFCCLTGQSNYHAPTLSNFGGTLLWCLCCFTAMYNGALLQSQTSPLTEVHGSSTWPGLDSPK